MDQLHKRLSAEQVKLLFQRYDKGALGRNEVVKILGFGKTRFFALLKKYRKGLENFSILYQ